MPNPPGGPRPSLFVAWTLAALLSSAATTGAGAAQITRYTTPVPVLPNAVGFEYKGPVAQGDLLNLQSQLSALPADAQIVIVLDSLGGNLSEGVALGKFFHQAKIVTVVAGGGACASACALAFLGGRDGKTSKATRIKSSTAKLGFHQFNVKFDAAKKYTKKDRDDAVAGVQQVTFRLVEYLKEIDEDLTLLPYMLRAPNEQIRLMSNEEALAAGIHVFNEQTKMVIDPSVIRQRIKER